MPLLEGVSIAILLCVLQNTKGDNFAIEIGSPANSDYEVTTFLFALGAFAYLLFYCSVYISLTVWS